MILNLKTKGAIGGVALAAIVLVAYFFGGIGSPKFHPLAVELPLKKSCMVQGILQNKGTARATNVTVHVAIYTGDIDKWTTTQTKVIIECSGEPRQLLFEFRAVVFQKLDAYEVNSWKLTWDDATPSVKERFRDYAVGEFEIKGTVKVVVDITCNEGVKEHWEFTLER